MKEFHCKRCGKCCGIVPFSKQEYKAIRNIAEQRHISFVKEDWGNKVVYFPKDVYKKFIIAGQKAMETGRELDNELDDLRCPFLEFDFKGLASCSIYEHRPELCRLYGKGGHRDLTCPNNLQFALKNK